MALYIYIYKSATRKQPAGKQIDQNPWWLQHFAEGLLRVDSCSLAAAMSTDGKVTFDCTGLGAELEKDGIIREHLHQKGAVLFEDGYSESIKNACQDPVFQALQILCLRTAVTEGHPQPPVGPLRDELELLYKKCGAQSAESAIVNDSWCIRKFMTFIKMKVRKEMVSTVSCTE